MERVRRLEEPPQPEHDVIVAYVKVSDCIWAHVEDDLPILDMINRDFDTFSRRID